MCDCCQQWKSLVKCIIDIAIAKNCGLESIKAHALFHSFPYVHLINFIFNQISLIKINIWLDYFIHKGKCIIGLRIVSSS